MTAVQDYDGLITALRARADELALSTMTMDVLSGLPTGYVGKLFGPSRVKMIGLDSLWLLTDVLALDVVLVPSLEKARRMELRWEKRDELRRRPGVLRKRFSPELRAKVASEIGRIGGSMPKRFRISKKERRAINKRNAERGWRKRRRQASRPMVVGSTA